MFYFFIIFTYIYGDGAAATILKNINKNAKI